MMYVLVLLLLVSFLVYVVLGWLQSGRRAKLGLTNEAVVVAADDSEIGLPTLRSDRLGLVGRPDQLVRVGGHVIPVEQKPRAMRVHDSHVMQLAAECAAEPEDTIVARSIQIVDADGNVRITLQVSDHGSQVRVSGHDRKVSATLYTVDSPGGGAVLRLEVSDGSASELVNNELLVSAINGQPPSTPHRNADKQRWVPAVAESDG